MRRRAVKPGAIARKKGKKSRCAEHHERGERKGKGRIGQVGERTANSSERSGKTQGKGRSESGWGGTAEQEGLRSVITSAKIKGG